MKTLYVSDLDGTLLNSSQQITPFTASVIAELLRKGGCFSYATARSLITAGAVTKELDLPFPAILYNGVFIRDTQSGEYLARHTFESGRILTLIDTLSKKGLWPIVYSVIDGVEKFSYITERLTPEQSHFVSTRDRADPRLREVSTTEELCMGEIFYLAYLGSKEQLSPLDSLCEGYGIHLFQHDTYDDFYWLEVMPQAATKANAAKELAKMLGCGRIVAFGDGLNDAELFSAADECYAVGNACEELKLKADAVIGSNDSDGVAHWIYENVLTKGDF
ncbi:HAD family hydrolase [Ruminococcus sp. NK3A76]|uniref:HAD family hydrolase n=1 Tax=Ruminococcus sp. NK3A76 TaxID=877411 RepID=UPI00048A5460|nr:HAD family hydrolase [Ruminococcus sp. NK3A76]